jgi:alpha-L-fucosidase 2
MMQHAESAWPDQPEAIELLPALPPQWPTGKVAGLLARGRFEVNIQWRDGKLVRADIKNNGPQGSVDVSYGEKTARLMIDAGAKQAIDGALSDMTQ